MITFLTFDSSLSGALLPELKVQETKPIIIFGNRDKYVNNILYINTKHIENDKIEKFDKIKFTEWAITFNPFNTTFFEWIDNPEEKIPVSRTISCGEKENIFPYSCLVPDPTSVKTDVKPLVTVIITSYNRYEMLLKAIQSVKNQTLLNLDFSSAKIDRMEPKVPSLNLDFSSAKIDRMELLVPSLNLEIIIINDCSDDPRYKDLGSKVPNVNIIHLPVRSKDIFGYACPGGWQRNFGMLYGSGEYFAFLDDDDEFEPDKLKIQIELMKKYNIKMSSTNATRSDKKLYLQPKQDEIIYHAKEKILKKTDLNNVNYIICSSIVIHSDLIKKAGWFKPLSYADDYEYWLRILNHTDLLFINKPLVKYNTTTNKNYSKESIKWVQDYQSHTMIRTVLNNFPTLSFIHEPDEPNHHHPVKRIISPSKKRIGITVVNNKKKTFR